MQSLFIFQVLLEKQKGFANALIANQSLLPSGLNRVYFEPRQYRITCV